MKIILTFLALAITTTSLAQKTFQVDTLFLDTLTYPKYKVFIASKDLDINFIGKKIPAVNRFTPEIAEAQAANNAIQTQYADAAIYQLDKQNNQASFYSDTSEQQAALKKYKERRPKIMHRLYQDQKNKIQNFDRYFWGYRNEDNERLILIRFDPHKIRHYIIPGSGETLIDVLTIMVYNIDRNVLSYGGWADFKE